MKSSRDKSKFTSCRTAQAPGRPVLFVDAIKYFSDYLGQQWVSVD
jgi:hypothetical protein